MCTLTIARDVFDKYPLVVAANRDELLDRPSERPQSYEESGLHILAPKDLQRGGTWMGVNSAGLFAGITNRIDVKSTRGCKSRGSLVVSALRNVNAQNAYDELMGALSANDFNGFNLVVADRKKSFLIQGNKKQITGQPIEESFWVVSNQGVGCSIPTTSRRVNNALRYWHDADVDEKEPTVENLSGLLNVHDAWRYGTCINQPKQNYGTKSSSIILLGENGWKYNHRERTSSEHICKTAFDPVIEFPIGDNH